MNDDVIRMRLMSLLMLALVSAMVWLYPATYTGSQATTNLSVTYLDVGQGDATLITTPEGVEVLIDGGRDGAVLRELAKNRSWFDREIDLVIATHPDSDHIGGLIDVLERYQIGSILMTENKNDTPAAAEYARLVKAEGAEVMMARRGQSFVLGTSTKLEVLWPETDPTELESNASSIIIKLTYGETSFIFTADAPKNIEEYLVLAYGEHLKADVLKVGHHGSRTSTSEIFLDEVEPRLAVISAGKDNSYGHPHVEVTDLLFNNRVDTFNTAEVGSVILLSDGETVWVKE